MVKATDNGMLVEFVCVSRVQPATCVTDLVRRVLASSRSLSLPAVFPNSRLAASHVEHNSEKGSDAPVSGSSWVLLNLAKLVGDDFPMWL
jgi:hypothetical protein